MLLFMLDFTSLLKIFLWRNWQLKRFFDLLKKKKNLSKHFKPKGSKIGVQRKEYSQQQHCQDNHRPTTVLFLLQNTSRQTLDSAPAQHALAQLLTH